MPWLKIERKCTCDCSRRVFKLYMLNWQQRKSKQKIARITIGCLEPLISSPAWVESVIVLLAGERSSFHLLEDLLCLKSQARSDGTAEAEDGDSFWFSLSRSRGPSRTTSNFWYRKATKYKSMPWFSCVKKFDDYTSFKIIINKK